MSSVLDADPRSKPRVRSAWRVALPLALILAVALALRLYGLGTLPYGLHFDEAHNGLDAVEILRGWRPAFLPRNNGREPLFMYLMAAVFAVAGPTIEAIRATGVLASLLAILAQFAFVRVLPLPRPRSTALLSSAILAVTFWPIAQAHLGLRAGLLPVPTALALAAWWRAIAPYHERMERQPDNRLRPKGSRSLLWATATGVLVSAAVYTHITGRLLPIILAVPALWIAVRHRRPALVVLLVVALCVAALLALPQAFFFRDRPDLFFHRASQVSALNPLINSGDIGQTLVDNARNLLLMATVRGSMSWSENLRGRPVFDPLVGLAFLVGLAVLGRDLAGRRGELARTAAVLVASTLGLMLVPSWLSEDAPSYIRLTGVWPALFLLPAWGLERTAAWLEQHGSPRSSAALVATVMAVSLIWTTVDFTVRYPAGLRAEGIMVDATAERGRTVAGFVAQGATYVTPAVWSQAAVQFLTLGAPPRSFDPRAGIVLPPQGGAGYVFALAERADGLAFARRWGASESIVGDLRAIGPDEGALAVYHLPADARPSLPAAPPVPPNGIFGDNIRLVGWSVEPLSPRPGSNLTVTLDWEALVPTASDMNFFVHIVTDDNYGIGQFDSPPLGGSYPTTRWAPGEHIIQRIEIPISAAPTRRARVRVGWYDWRTGERLPVPGDDDAALELAVLEVAT